MTTHPSSIFPDTDAETASPEEPLADITSAEEDHAALLRAKDEEIHRLNDAYLRAMAETENLRARHKRELDDAGKYAATKFAREMVNILENLARAVQSIPGDAKAQHNVVRQVSEGLDMTMQEALGIFERSGVTRIEPLGQKFDHHLHQAVAQVPSETHAPGTVLSVLQAGYQLHDRLLRPAMVTVASAPPAVANATPDAG